MKKFVMKTKIFFLFTLILNLGLLTTPITIEAESRNGLGIIGYGDAYTPTRVISVITSLTNNNGNLIYYEVYSPTIYLSVLALGSNVTSITVDGNETPFKITTLGNTAVYELDNIQQGKHTITVHTNNLTTDYKSTSNFININVKPNVQVMPELLNVPLFKNFKIRFNKPVMDDGSLNNYISILNQTNDKYDFCTSSVSSSDPYTIDVLCQNPFIPSTDYTLHVLPGIKSTSGTSLSQEQVLRFKTSSSLSLSNNIYSSMKATNFNTKEDLMVNFK